MIINKISDISGVIKKSKLKSLNSKSKLKNITILKCYDKCNEDYDN